jgi:hypothetical protein
MDPKIYYLAGHHTPYQRHRRPRTVHTSGVWVRRIQSAHGFGPFATFSSGTGKFEKKVNDIITGRFRGEGPAANWVVMETGYGQLVGACAYVKRPLTYDVLPTPAKPTPTAINTSVTVPGAAYVHVIAIKEEYRGLVLRDGRTMGTYLLTGTQGVIKREWANAMPWTWAYVEDENQPSHNFFYEHGFGYVPPQKPEEDWKHIWNPIRRFEDVTNAVPPWEFRHKRSA